jgi:hypothetical protein
VHKIGCGERENASNANRELPGFVPQILCFRRSGGWPRFQEGLYPIEGAPCTSPLGTEEARRAEVPETHSIGQLPASAPLGSLRFDFHGPAHPRLMHRENTPIGNPSAVKSEPPIPGPQRRGAEGTLIRVGKSYRGRGRPLIGEAAPQGLKPLVAPALFGTTKVMP